MFMLIRSRREKISVWEQHATDQFDPCGKLFPDRYLHPIPSFDFNCDLLLSVALVASG